MKRIWILALAMSLVQCKEAVTAQKNKKETATTTTTTTTTTTEEKEVADIVTYLASDELGGRDTGTEGYEKAVVYVENTFKKFGVAPYFESYRDNFEVQGQKTCNVVGYLKGTDEKLANEFVILGAHLDHIGHAKENEAKDKVANGANDNAAGSAAVISLARYFAEKKDNKRSILFVLFGAEERGLLGSKNLAGVLKEKNLDLYTMVNFEMIGVPMNNKNYTAYITGFHKSNMAQKMNEYAGKDLVGFLEKAKEFSLFKRSDNYPFHQVFNVPAQTISTFDFTNYKYYHHVDDEAAEMDFAFMARLINECAPVLSKIINAKTKEIVYNN